MSLTLQTIEELESLRVRVINRLAGPMEENRFDGLYSELMPDLLSAAKWALLNGFKQE